MPVPGLVPGIPTTTGVAKEAVTGCNGAYGDGRDKPHRHQDKAGSGGTAPPPLEGRGGGEGLVPVPVISVFIVAQFLFKPPAQAVLLLLAMGGLLQGEAIMEYCL